MLTWKTVRLLAPYIIGAAIIIGLVLWGHSKEAAGYTRGKAEAAALVESERNAELKRQLAANQEAQRQAQAAISTLRQEQELLAKTLEENALAASQDPRADSCGVSPDSVQRLNRIR